MNNKATVDLTKSDLFYRIVSDAIDLALIFSGLLLWWIFLFLILGSIISYTYFSTFQMISIIAFNTIAILVPLFFVWKYPGKSLGKIVMGFTITHKDGTPATLSQLVLREVVLKSIVYVLLVNFMSTFGLWVYLLILFVSVLLAPTKDVLDRLTNTKVMKSVDYLSIQHEYFGTDFPDSQPVQSSLEDTQVFQVIESTSGDHTLKPNMSSNKALEETQSFPKKDYTDQSNGATIPSLSSMMKEQKTVKDQQPNVDDTILMPKQNKDQ